MGGEVDDLRREVERLRVALDQRREEAEVKEQQLERYAAELREASQEERAGSVELRRSYVVTVRALANAVEARDAYTGAHAERVAAYGLRLAAALPRPLVADPQIEFGFLLHDVGKVAIPDAILFKPGPLSDEERILIERHPVIGCDILRDVEFLGAAKSVVRHHHERFDGTGYPDALAGEDIPLPARVFAVADTLDALTTDRPYRRGESLRAARRVIADNSGSQFDPAVVEALERITDAEINRLRNGAG